MTEQGIIEAEKFISRDISWLTFNERVLEEAADKSNPLMERTKFLAIYVNNLDEFLMVRLAAVKRLIESGHKQRDIFGYLPPELLLEMKVRIILLTKRLYAIYHEQIQPELQQNNIFIKKYPQLSPDQKKYIRRYFETTLFPIITPMAVDQGRPFPLLPSKTIAFAVALQKQRIDHLAIIPVPTNIPRLIKVPSDNKEDNFILLEEVLRYNIDSFFKGYTIVATTLFRLMRDSELSVEEDDVSDLLPAIEDEVKKRLREKITYIEMQEPCSSMILDLMSDVLKFPRDDIALIEGDLDLKYLFDLAGEVAQPEFCYLPLHPVIPEYENIFDYIKEGDFLLHLPYESFAPTVDLIQLAADDPQVLAIKMTLYRTNEGSAIIEGLKRAAKNGKQVTILVEIKARFDEERNINWVRQLEDAGCHVMYGLAGMKVHAKMVLIVRKEEGRIRRYVHLSTGNYNEKTAKVYTDLGYFTANDDFARDLSDLFNIITGYSTPSRWQRIVSSPYDLRNYFYELIDNEILCQQQYGNGFIFAKMNSLEDTEMIEKLYQASQVGVKIHLLVRGICCLRPGVKGLSETIAVQSIVGRFLEHSRIFSFYNNGNERIFLSSADWMRRNLNRRIELLFEIYNQELKDMIKFILRKYWQDNCKVWQLQTDGVYIKPKPSEPISNSQEYLLHYYTQSPERLADTQSRGG